MWNQEPVFLQEAPGPPLPFAGRCEIEIHHSGDFCSQGYLCFPNPNYLVLFTRPSGDRV